jgi:hypothetical protein
VGVLKCPDDTCTTHLDHFYFGRLDPFQDELSNSITGLDLKVFTPEVEEDHAQEASVIGVDDACSRIDSMFKCYSGKRSRRREVGDEAKLSWFASRVSPS